MSEIERDEAVEFVSEKTIDPIQVICTGSCGSLSGRSDLTFSIGRHAADGTHFLSITGNTGRGMFSSQFVPAMVIQEVVLGVQEISGQSLAVLYPNVSSNSKSFLLAILKEIGLVEVNPDQTRHYRHVIGKTMEMCIASYMARVFSDPPKRRKTKEA